MSLGEPPLLSRPPWVGVTTTLGRMAYALGALPAALMALMIPLFRGEREYCGPPDHTGPCDRIQEMSAASAAGLGLGVLTLLAAGAIAQSVGRRLAETGRERRGVALVLGMLAVPAVTYAMLAYGYTTA
ncbi:hypothetical protein DMB38_14065 [Streptomyces sp. WAC 06738]|uniref:hypothetical protein n=1 Tax=Streptomyces sp. WAC 06738 TaxID=2203210 RepID=UPI000F6E3C8D|nr:hypothetical protein [Streptomyces sp. WAC 06738]AZM46784.1 hypothetical protein DMB38_14065 [Streptomyces sp. WAC 06738]